jgi:hypothetical protein
MRGVDRERIDAEHAAEAPPDRPQARPSPWRTPASRSHPPAGRKRFARYFKWLLACRSLHLATDTRTRQASTLTRPATTRTGAYGGRYDRRQHLHATGKHRHVTSTHRHATGGERHARVGEPHARVGEPHAAGPHLHPTGQEPHARVGEPHTTDWHPHGGIRLPLLHSGIQTS